MSERFKPLSETIGPLFAQLEQRVAAHVELTERVRAALTGPEKDHVVSASCRGDTLVVLADSAAWCPQIRYAQARLLELLEVPIQVQVRRRSQKSKFASDSGHG